MAYLIESILVDDDPVSKPDLREYLAAHEIVTVERYGPAGDGTTDDTTAVSDALDELTSRGGGDLYVQRSYAITDLAIPSRVRIYGPGKLIGATIAHGDLPSVTLSAAGTVGSTINFGSTIAQDTKSFTVSNSYAVGDMLLLYNTASGNQDNMRMELLQVATRSGSAFTTTTGTLHAYGDTTNHFKLITPARGIEVLCGLENIALDFDYCRGVRVAPWQAIRTNFNFARSWGFTIDCADFDSRDSGCLVSAQAASRNFSIVGNYTGGAGTSDNGLIKTNGTSYYNVNANVNGTYDDGGYLHGFFADTYYEDSIYGYENLTNAHFTVNINSRDVYGSAVFVSSQSTAADVKPHDGVLSGNWGYGGAKLTNTNGIILRGSAKTGVLQLTNTTNTIVETDNFDSYNITGTNTGLQGVWQAFTPIVSGLTGSAPEPTMDGAAVGRYMKIGRRVHLHVFYKWTSAGSRSGGLLLVLPAHTAKNTSSLGSALSVGYTVGLTKTNGVTVSILPNTQYAYVYNDGATQQAVTSSGTIEVNGSYETDA